MAEQTTGTVLVIGASRGLGLALAEEWLRRGWHVIATCRGSGRTRLHEVAERSAGRLAIEKLDMVDPASVESLTRRLQDRSLDVLFVNAGVANGPEDRVDDVSTEEFTRLLVTNALSPMRVVERLGGLVGAEGTIAVMSSMLGSVSLNDHGGWEVYRASKAALNTLMRSYAARHAAGARSLVLMDPGWVRTDMGGAAAELEIGDSIPGVVETLAALAGMPGLRYVNYRGETVPW